MNWKLDYKIEKILESNIKEIPYEGKEVNSIAIRDSLNELIVGLLKGYQTYVNQNYILTNNGWKNKNIINKTIKSREDIVKEFLDSSL